MHDDRTSVPRPVDLEGRGAERPEFEKAAVFEALEDARAALDGALDVTLYAMTGPLDPRIVEALEQAGLANDHDRRTGEELRTGFVAARDEARRKLAGALDALSAVQVA